MSEEEYRRNVNWLLNNGYAYRAIRELTEELQYELPRPNGCGFYNARCIVWHVHSATRPSS